MKQQMYQDLMVIQQIYSHDIIFTSCNVAIAVSLLVTSCCFNVAGHHNTVDPSPDISRSIAFLNLRRSSLIG
jgi:hypothetical protein